MQGGWRSSGSGTSPAWAESSRREGTVEPLDSRDQSLSVIRFKKPVERQKRSCMSKCKGALGSCVFFYRASLRVCSCQGHPVSRKMGNSYLVTSTQEDIKEKDQLS